MKPFQLCGLGNAIVDIFVEISDAEFASLGFERGGMVLVDLPAQRTLLDRYQKHEPRLASGGSVANSVIAFSQLGGQGAFIGCVGDDRYGLFYAKEFEELGIEIGNPVIVNEFTGTSVCIVTPDAERTMRTCLGVASHLPARHVDEARIRDSEWLFIEGYVFANPDTGQTAIQEAIRVARQHGTKIAAHLLRCVRPAGFREPLNSALQHAELLFCNETEACSITGASGAEDAFEKLKDIVPSVVVTNGPHGAYIRHGGIEKHVAAFPSEPKDLTGAGDMFAGAFLYGITHGVPADHAARAASFLSHKVITQVGARLHQGTRQFWDECLASV